MTDKIILELTLDELKLIDKYVELNEETESVFDKIKYAYPQPKMTLENEGEFAVVSYNNTTYYRLMNETTFAWYMKIDYSVPTLVMVTDAETERLLEGLYYNDIVVKKEKEMIRQNLKTSLEELANGDVRPIDDVIEEAKEQQLKSSAEECYKEWWGEYPTIIWQNDVNRWAAFQAGYNAAYREPQDNEWKNVALEFGKKLPAILPYSYAELSPNSWYKWVVFTYDKYMEERDKECGYTPNQKAQEPEEQVSFVPKEIKELVEEGVKWCEEHPDTDPLDWVKPQNPEQVADGLKEAFREAIKQGVVSSTKSKTLTDLIYRWWEDVFTTHSNWDMETSIEDLVDQIEMWLPKEHDTNSYKWNQCIRTIKEKLR